MGGGFPDRRPRFDRDRHCPSGGRSCGLRREGTSWGTHPRCARWARWRCLCRHRRSRFRQLGYLAADQEELGGLLILGPSALQKEFERDMLSGGALKKNGSASQSNSRAITPVLALP